MIIRGGQIFILDDDMLPKVTITEATIVTGCSGMSLEDQTAYISDRLGRGSEVTACTFMPIERWAAQKSKEATDNAKSDAHLKEAQILPRLRKFLKLGAS